MKFLTTLISAMSAPSAEGSVRALVRLLAVLVVAVAVFSVGFHYVMELEGRQFSWWASIYWTVVTMSTLGYGDITFTSGLGQMYSLVVLMAGAILILVLLPFTFIQVVYLPWRAATRQASAPRRLPESLSDHVILTQLEPVTRALIDRFDAARVPYALLVDDVDMGVNLHDEGYRVAVGALDDPATYRAVGAERAAMLFTSKPDETNTNVVFTWREVTDGGKIVATAASEDAVDILELVGCDRVLQLGEVLGRAFARRILSPTARSTVVATFDDLVIAEASAAGTELVGRSLTELGFRRRFGISVVGLWERGQLRLPDPDRIVDETSILLLLGRPEQIDRYDESTAPGGQQEPVLPEGPVVILGGGRVGRTAARALGAAGIDACVVERLPERVHPGLAYVVGDAADRDVLREAGIDDASAVIVTTHDDDTNIYLTLYCRRLRPDIEILGRVNSDRNLTTMHRAGADVALSYASTGATEVWNELRGDSRLLLAEGLLVFRSPVPTPLAGRRLRDTDIRSETGCTVIALSDGAATTTEIDADTVLPEGAQMVLIGDDEGEERFLRRYVRDLALPRWRRLLRRAAPDRPSPGKREK